MDERRCTICGRTFEPDPRARLQQKCCGPRCSKKLKRRRDKIHNQLYRRTGLGREQRRRDNRVQRERLGWNDYMHFWRKADPRKIARQERERSRRYYQAHREEILEKRRQKRAKVACTKNTSPQACSH